LLHFTIINDDDALELFKKTLPSAASSFVQLQEGAASMRARALAALEGALGSICPDRTQIDLIGLALRGKKGFEKVIGMIDTLVATLKREQVDDESKKDYCSVQFDSADDKKKGLERTVSDEEGEVAKAEEGIAALKEEIAALEAGIKALDDSVAEATKQRKEEHEDFAALMASDSAAKEILGFAKNRLNKFYNSLDGSQLYQLRGEAPRQLLL
jgi:chromosome segregation ATPase